MATLLVPLTGRDAAGAKLIRDSEIENTIRLYGTPLFEAAGLRAADIRIFIIADESLNAFVAGGLNMFLHTGLLLEANSASEIIGVIAHETGHIAGGHLTRVSKRISSTSRAALIATILGALTTAATGSGEAGAAVMMGGQGLAVGSLLAYSRTQESAADQAGLRFLDLTGQSARGMLDFFKTLEDQELLPAHRQNPYVRTHPITRYRIEDVESHIARSPHSDTPPDPRFEELFRRMRAKLHGFLLPPERTLQTYPAADRSIAARYARAIAYYRSNDLDRALPELDQLIAEEPKNPYFFELKGQALLEAGRIKEALPPYRTAVRLDPDAALIRIDLARTLLARKNAAAVKEAIEHLLFATREIPESATAWQQLAIAYGRDRQYGMSALALAEMSLIRGRFKEALYQAGRAEAKLARGSTGWIRAQDVKAEADRLLKEQRTRR
ncbi:MAG: M48 family metalloprotease [Alphaproteobacteria bacterium]|nr:M48 family metalloprotease [Alphaproteobacteria bacterium]